MKKLWKTPFRSMVFSAVLFGILSTLSLEPFNYPLTVYPCLWILFYQTQRLSQSPLKLMWFGFMSAFFLCVFGFYWTIHLFTVFGGLPLYLAVFTFIPYTFLLNLKIIFLVLALALVNQARIRRLRLPSLIVVPTLAVGLDLIFPQVFNWYWGNLLAGNPYFAQLAEYVGIHGLSFLLFFIGYGSYKLLCGPFYLPSYWNKWLSPGRWKVASPVIIVVVAGLMFGAYRKAEVEALQKELPHINAVAIQPDAPLEKAGGPRQVTPESILDIIQDTIPGLAKKAREEAKRLELDIDLVVLPESAIPYYTTQDNILTRRLNYGYLPEYEKMILDLASDFDAEVFFNQNAYGVSLDPNTGRPRRDAFNSSALFARNGKRAGYYHKQILIAFGEQIPYADFLDKSGLIMLVPETIRYSRFQRGYKYTLLPYQSLALEADPSIKPQYDQISDPNAVKREDIRKAAEALSDRDFTPVGQFMPLICYEILSPNFIRKFFHENQRNPDFMVNITQDKWYGKTIETFQHFELGRIRAIETRRAIVRSTNSGTSGMVDLAGNYAKPEAGQTLTGQETQEFQIFRVPVHRGQDTLYVRLGDWWFGIPVGLLMLLLMARSVGIGPGAGRSGQGNGRVIGMERSGGRRSKPQIGTEGQAGGRTGAGTVDRKRPDDTSKREGIQSTVILPERESGRKRGSTTGGKGRSGKPGPGKGRRGKK